MADFIYVSVLCIIYVSVLCILYRYTGKSYLAVFYYDNFKNTAQLHGKH